jgi:hypothetical protein
MSQQTFDPGSKWMIEEQGASILYVAGARSVISCKARKAEVVQPRQLPDGLLEARFADRTEPGLVLVEFFSAVDRFGQDDPGERLASSSEHRFQGRRRGSPRPRCCFAAERPALPAAFSGRLSPSPTRHLERFTLGWRTM